MPITSALAQQAPNDEVRAVVAEMLSDAQARTSLLAPSSGHDGKFFLASDDGNFRLNIDGLVQFRYFANFRSDNNSNEFEHGFQTQFTKIRFSGNIVDSKWLYNVEGNFEHDGGSFVLEDAWVAYKLSPEWLALWGQVKAPVLREWMVDDRYQLAAGRSITQQAFNHGRSQVAGVQYTGADFMAAAFFSDGAGSANTDFTSSAEADWSLSARAAWKFAGDWAAFNDFTSFKGSKFAGMLGGAVHFQGSQNTSAITDTDTKVLLYTVDAQFEGDGWNCFGAFIGRNIEFRSMGSDTDVDDFGVVLQGGFFLSEMDELFARYDVVIPDSDRAGDPDPFSTLTVGWNHYIARHAAKFTLDLQYAFDAITDTAAVPTDTETGLLGDVDDGEIIARAQFQLLF
ncbi:MAG: hypothetical protein AB7G11_06715 [Phycisphaerales bacterium]